MRLPFHAAHLVSFITVSLSLALGAAGCGTYVTATYLNGNEPAPTTVARAPRGVQVFATAPPARPYREVALLEVAQDHGFNDQGTDVMLDRLRERAAEMGCDGVVLGGFSETSDTDTRYVTIPGHTTLHATCIVFTHRPRHDAAPPVASAPPTEDQRIDLEDPGL